MLALGCRQFTVEDLRYALEIRRPFGCLGFAAERLDAALEIMERLEGHLLAAPLAGELVVPLLLRLQLLLDLLEARFRGLGALLQERLLFHFAVRDLAAEPFDLLGHAVGFEPADGRGLVHEVDRLIRQKAVGDVARGKLDGRGDRFVRNADAVVDLVLLFETAKHRDRILDRGLVHHDRLEAALERRILLDMALVLADGRRADGVKFAARQGRLQEIRGVHRALRGACAHDNVDLVNEENEAAGCVLDLLHERLETVLELAAELGARDERPEVEHDDLFVLEGLRHVAVYDALGQPLHDGGLPHARLADEDRVVLGAAREHLDEAAQLFIAADHRVQLPLAGHLRKIDGVLFEHLELALRRFVSHASRAAQLREDAKRRLAAESGALEKRLRRARSIEKTEQ